MATITRGELQDIHYSFYDDKEKIKSMAVAAYLRAVDLVGIMEVIMVTPMKRNEGLTASVFNNIIQEKLIKNKDIFVEYGNTKFYIGSKVIQTENDYHGKGVINGEMGFIKDILEDRIIVEMSDGDIEYPKGDIKQLELAYCITGHKYQGSQAKIVIIVIDTSHYIMLSRQWLYTAITRGIDTTYIIGSKKAFAIAIKTTHAQRRTFLQHIIKNKDYE